MTIATYEELLLETLPRRIESEEQYEAIQARFGALLVKQKRSKAEEELRALLGVLIEDYDRRNALPPDHASLLERLQFLMEQSGKSPADLLPVFGQRSHVHEALTGKRAVSGAQARKLAKLFRVHPGFFL